MSGATELLSALILSPLLTGVLTYFGCKVIERLVK